MFSAHLANPPQGDPALLVRFQGHHFMFDCGFIPHLSAAQLLPVRRLFISHTHIDHCIGLDSLLRVQLFSPQPLDIYGPEGLLEQFSGRLRGYAWNLSSGSPYQIGLHEIGAEQITSRVLECAHQFRPGPRRRRRHHGQLELPEGVTLSWIGVEHGVPCLAYRLQGKPFWRFRSEAARRLGLNPGPWVGQLTEALERGRLERWVKLPVGRRRVGEWAQELFQEEPAPSLSYLTDSLLDESCRARFAPFVAGSGQLWCEATYRQEDSHKTLPNLHASSDQAARLALESRVARLYLFHLSRRYNGDIGPSLEQARAIFPDTEWGPQLTQPDRIG